MNTAEINATPNHYMLQLAREARELTQAELSAKMGTTQATLSKYENGLHPAPFAYVQEVAAALSFPVSFFYEPGRPYGFPPFHYRKRKKLSKKALGRIIAEMNIRRMHVQKLLVSYEYKASRYIPEIDRDEYKGGNRGVFSVEEAATSIRGHMMLPRGPLKGLVDLIEECGGIVIECDFGTDLLDAMSQRIDGLPILFFVNKSIPGDRMRHTLAHELAHMILHTTLVKDDEDMEQEADDFAGALLLPADEISHYLKKLDFNTLANLKLYWQVAISALAVRADRLKLVSEYEKKRFWIQYNQLRYRYGEPAPIAREKPTLLKKIVRFHMEDLKYSADDMANLLHLNFIDFAKTYLDRPALQIVS